MVSRDIVYYEVSIGSSAPISRIVYGQLRAGFEKGAQHIAPRLVDALVDVYARLFTVEELQALITFEQQPAQRAAEAALRRRIGSHAGLRRRGGREV
jgi:hypothetical protein